MWTGRVRAKYWRRRPFARVWCGDKGVETRGTITHDFWEEVWILEGELIDLGKRQTFGAGMYACRPPGMVHGPYRVDRGCVTLEIRYGATR